MSSNCDSKSKRWCWKDHNNEKFRKALSVMGKRVLVIDFDPQFSLSTSLGYDNTDNKPFTIGDLMDRVIESKSLPQKKNMIIF